MGPINNLTCRFKTYYEMYHSIMPTVSVRSLPLQNVTQESDLPEYDDVDDAHFLAQQRTILSLRSLVAAAAADDDAGRLVPPPRPTPRRRSSTIAATAAAAATPSSRDGKKQVEKG